MTIVYIGAAALGFTLGAITTGSILGGLLLACVVPAVVAALTY